MKVESSRNSFTGDYYENKPAKYFAGARWDWIRELPLRPEAAALEVGCGSGDTGAAALSERKCGRYCGVEICESAAREAGRKISEILVGNVEFIELPWPPETFDILIISEVLEHLVDPWQVLRRLRPLMKPGAMVFASSPNISHYRVVLRLLRGQWDLSDSGVMDRTHLRWFTPDSYGKLFEETGYRVERVGPVTPFSWRTRLINAVTFGYLSHIFVVQTNIRCTCPPQVKKLAGSGCQQITATDQVRAE